MTTTITTSACARCQGSIRLDTNGWEHESSLDWLTDPHEAVPDDGQDAQMIDDNPEETAMADMLEDTTVLDPVEDRLNIPQTERLSALRGAGRVLQAHTPAGQIKVEDLIALAEWIISGDFPPPNNRL